LSRPDPKLQCEALSALPRLPRDADGPVFAEPWQAEAFALAVRLSAQGYFTWKEWTDAISRELARPAELHELDPATVYYRCWLAALECLVNRQAFARSAGLVRSKDGLD
jgi:nitrile hydratase accessory protein